MKNINEYMLTQPKARLALVVVLFEFALFYFDHYSGPHVPFWLFYLLSIFIAVRYVSVGFGYLLSIFSAMGKTYISWLFHQDDHMLINAYELFSNASIDLLFCYLMDAQMTARLRAESALDDLSKLHQAIISKTDSGIVVFKSSGECVIANGAAANILGTTLDRLLRERFYDFPSWQASGLLELAKEVLETGQSRQFDAPLHTKFGSSFWCIASLGRIDLKEGGHLLLVFSDISNYKEAIREMSRARESAQAAELRAGEAERHILSISEETQQRIGQELHDDLGQQLTGVAFMSQVLTQKLKQKHLDEEQDAAKITRLVNDAVSKTRRLAQGLYPVESSASGLREMLAQLCADFEEIYPVACELVYDESCDLDEPEVVINLFRICQEAINNAIKHGHASKISVTVVKTSAGNIIEISDNGTGLGKQGVEKKSGLGMHTMRYRAQLVGATLDIDSNTSGGVCVTINLPAATD